jgi:hypothetical protein
MPISYYKQRLSFKLVGTYKTSIITGFQTITEPVSQCGLYKHAWQCVIFWPSSLACSWGVMLGLFPVRKTTGSNNSQTGYESIGSHLWYVSQTITDHRCRLWLGNIEPQINFQFSRDFHVIQYDCKTAFLCPLRGTEYSHWSRAGYSHSRRYRLWRHQTLFPVLY